MRTPGRTAVAAGVGLGATVVALSVGRVVGAWALPWLALFWLVPSLGCVAGLLEW